MSSERHRTLRLKIKGGKRGQKEDVGIRLRKNVEGLSREDAFYIVGVDLIATGLR